MTPEQKEAKRKKNDEFYTQLVDVERELRHYRHHFKGKVVYCNCDDPSISAFTEYFQKQYKHLDLKGLVTTCYQSRQGDLWSQGKIGHGLMLRHKPPRRTKKDGDIIQPAEPKILKGDGDFRSSECMKIMEKADIVVTNPPFSLIREYLPILMEYQKRFIIMAPQNIISYKEIFPFIQSEKMWLGVNNGGNKWFGVNDHIPKGTDHERVVNGHWQVKLRNIIWLTNLDHSRRHEEPVYWMSYDKNPESYPRYDNYDAIEVGRLANIPNDYFGLMGVPITYLAQHNPDHFQIMGLGRELVSKGKERVEGLYLQGKEKYARIVIQRRS